MQNNYSIWCGLSSDIKISKFETILRRDSTLHIKKTFQSDFRLFGNERAEYSKISTLIF